MMVDFKLDVTDVAELLEKAKELNATGLMYEYNEDVDTLDVYAVNKDTHLCQCIKVFLF